MFKKDSEFTEAEKIDYVFSRMRKQAKVGTLMTVLKLMFYGGIIYFYIMIVPNLDIDKLAEKYVIPKMSKIVEATAKQTMQNVGGSALNGGEIDPQLLEMINGGAAAPTSGAAQSGTTAAKKRNLPKIKITPEKTQEIMDILGE